MKKNFFLSGLLIIFVSLTFSAFRAPFFALNNSNLPVAGDSLNQDLHQIGQSIVKEGFQVLGSQLRQAIEKGGVPYALSFCNVKALPLTDSVARKHQIHLKRVSDKNRNPENAANEQELLVMELMRKAGTGKKMEMTLYDENGTATYYAPIILGAPCLQCHGTPGSNITNENMEIIKKLYPNDKATGYNQGELRGLWVVRFEK